jgi:microcystin-dependent protein
MMPLQTDFLNNGAMTDIAKRLNDLEKFVREHQTESSSSGTTETSGIIKLFGGAAAPAGYLLCDGTSYLRATYPDLFTAIGTTFGSVDGTHFNVPDLRGRVPVGVGTGTGGGSSGTGLPSGGSALTAVAMAGWKGEETHALSVAELPAHHHTFGVRSGAGATPGLYDSNTNTGTSNSSDTGTGTAHNVIQPVMGVNFVIKT